MKIPSFARFLLIALLQFTGNWNSIASSSELLSNRGFESGDDGYWTANTLAGPTAAGILQGSYPHTPGTWYGYVGNSLKSTGSLFQILYVPAGAGIATVTFYLNVASSETTTVSKFDVMDINFRTYSPDTLITKLGTFSNLDKTANGVYAQKTFTYDLSAYRSQLILLQFYATNDLSNSTVFRIDDVSVSVEVASPPPNLTPYKPSGPSPNPIWTDKIIVAKSAGATSDSSSIYHSDSLYVNWAVANLGNSVAESFYTSLYIDDRFIQSWQTISLSANTYTRLIDYPIGQLSGGTHILKIVTDSSLVITESDETDNEYTKQITVLLPAPSPDLVSVTGVPSSATVGQPFTVTIYTENDAGTGGLYSAINASILYDDGTDDVTITDATAPWANNLYNRAPGTALNNNLCNSMSAIDHWVEATDDDWTSGEQHSMSFTVTPNKTGTLYVRARVTLHDGNTECNYVNDTSASGGTSSIDQQGWTVRQYSVSVGASGPAPVAHITGNQRPVTGKATYDGTSSTGNGLQYAWRTRPDGQSWTLPTAQFTFNSPGSYWIDLTVTDSSGRQASDSFPIIVQADNNGSTSAQPKGADPVVLSSGNYIQQRVDLRLPGKGFPFEFTRFYNSKFADQTTHPLGYGWTHSYNEWIQDTGTNVLVTRGDGSVWTFFPTNGGFVGERGVYETLVHNGDGTWVLTNKAQTVNRFDTDGRLVSITDKNGNALNLYYEATTLRRIQDTAGRDILFGTNALGCISDITDPSGRIIRFEFDGQTNLQRVIDALNFTNSFSYTTNHQLKDAFDAKGTRFIHNEYNTNNFVVDRQCDAFTNWTYFTFDFTDRITWQTNALGKVSVYHFDDRLLVTNIVDEANHQQTFGYDENRNRTLIRDKNGNVTHYSYDSQGNVTNKTDALNNVTTIEYDSRNNPTRRIDPLSNITSFGYDSRGNLTSTTNALFFVSRVEYDPNGLPTVLTDARGFSTTNIYDSQGNLTAVIDAKGFTNRFEYDSVSRKVRQIDALNHASSLSLDNDDNLLFSTNALDFVNAFTYDGNKNRTSLRDPRGAVTTNVFDLKDRLVSTVAPLNRSSLIFYDALDRKIAAFDSLNNPTSYAFDDVGNLVAVTNALQQVTRFTFDPQGNPTSVIDPTGHYVTNIFDALNRKVATIDIGISTNLTQFDALGRVIATTNANGQVTRFNYDSIGRLTNVLDAASQPVIFDYDANGNRIRITDPNGHTWTNAFDELNRLFAQHDPQGHATLLAYDPTGNLTNKITPNNDSIHYGYDALNRLTNITYPSGPPVIFAYDSVGNRTNMVDSLGTTTWEFDFLNRLTSVTDPFGQTVSNGFDAHGNRVSLAYPGHKVVNYGFDPLNRMTVLTNWLGGVVSYDYDNRGNLTGTTNANGTTAAYTYDVANRLITLTNSAPNASVIAAYALTLDGIGNHQQLSHQQPLFPILSNQTNNYSYDSDNRLTGLDGQTVTHNSNGDLTSIGTNIYSYDFEDRLSAFALTNASGLCGYDGLGNRLTRTVNGDSKRFVLDRMGTLTQVLVETDTNSLPIAYYVFGLGLAQRISSEGTTSTYHFNLQGSTVAITDSGGNVTASYAFDSFGVLANANENSPQPFRYLGRYGIIDDSSGLLYARARYFNPQLGRFITKDPITGKDSDGQSLNRYVYALNSPHRLRDTTGLSPSEGDFSSVSLDLNIQTFGGICRMDIGDLIIPFGVDVDEIIREASKHRSDPLKLVWFYNQVRGYDRQSQTAGPWNFKHMTGQNVNSQYANFGNFVFGLAGKAVGIPAQTLLRAAGYKQRQDNPDPSWGVPWGFAPYGDDPVDQGWIKAGFDYYQSTQPLAIPNLTIIL